MNCVHQIIYTALSRGRNGKCRSLAAFFCCIVLTSTPAAAQVSWKHIGTVTTLTNGQLCKTDGAQIICDTTTPTIVSGLVGIGTALPSQLLTVGGNIDITGANGYLTEISNDATTGTTASKLAKLTISGAAIIAAATDTDGMIGVVTGGAGKTGNAQVAVDGQAACVFDGATTAGDFVSISATTAGDCHDAGATRSKISQTIGRVLSTNASGGTYAVELGLNADAASSGAVSGSGTTNYIAKWTPNGSTLGIGALYDNGSGSVGIGTTNPAGLFDVEQHSCCNAIAQFASNSIAQLMLKTTNGAAQAYIQFVAQNGNNVWQEVASGSGNDLYFGATGNINLGINTFDLNGNGGASIGAGSGYPPANGLTVKGNVGIGTNLPSDKFDVAGAIGITTTTATLPTNGIYSPSTNNLALTTNGAAAVTVTASGQVGVGTTAPATGVKEDIAGTVKVAGTGSEACSASTVGQIRYNSTGGYMEICTYP